MPELKLSSEFDKYEVSEPTQLVLPEESEVPYLTRAESDAEYDLKKNRSVFESAVAFLNNFDATGYIEDTWLPALKNESIMKGLITFDPDAYKAVGAAVDLGTRDLGVIGKKIIGSSHSSNKTLLYDY